MLYPSYLFSPLRVAIQIYPFESCTISRTALYVSPCWLPREWNISSFCCAFSITEEINKIRVKKLFFIRLLITYNTKVWNKNESERHLWSQTDIYIHYGNVWCKYEYEYQWIIYCSMVRVSFRLLLLKQQNSKIRMKKQLSMEPHKMDSSWSGFGTWQRN